MYCQQCGYNIRTSAKFCNKCGSKVKQRFGEAGSRSQPVPTKRKHPVAPPPPPPPLAEKRAEQKAKRREERRAADPPPFAQHSWPGAEEAIVMPVVDRPAPTQPPQPQPAPTQELPEILSPREVDSAAEMVVRIDLQRPMTTGSGQAPDTGEIERGLADRAERRQEYKPFFTQVGMAAVPNRQHNRVIMVVPLLLIVSILLFLFAYIASK